MPVAICKTKMNKACGHFDWLQWTQFKLKLTIEEQLAHARIEFIRQRALFVAFWILLEAFFKVLVVEMASIFVLQNAVRIFCARSTK